MKSMQYTLLVLVIAITSLTVVGHATGMTTTRSDSDWLAGKDGWTDFGGGWVFGTAIDPLDAGRTVAARAGDPQDIIGSPLFLGAPVNLFSGAGNDLKIETEMRWRQGATGDWSMLLFNAGNVAGQMGNMFAVFRPDLGNIEFRVERHDGGGPVTNVINAIQGGILLNPGVNGTYNTITIERDFATSSWTLSLNGSPLAGLANLVESTPLSSTNFGAANSLQIRAPESNFAQGPNVFFDHLTVRTTALIPEPATMALVGLGGGILLVRGRRRAAR